MPIAAPHSSRVIRDLRELAKHTSNSAGAQRVAWGPVWRDARAWFTKKVRRDLDLPVRTDAAGNNWVTLPGKSKKSVLFGSHLDCVPNGGWLDGCLGVVAGIEVLRRHAAAGTPDVTLHLVDWADEEGARFGRSLCGSAAAAGALDPKKELAHLVDRSGVKLPDALAENGVKLGAMLDAEKHLESLEGRAYLELHIEQGPVLEAMKKPTAVVLGTVGVERHLLRFVGQAAHSGATPIPLRRDAFLAAAEFALACREIGLRFSGPTPRTRVVATCGVVKVEPCIVTANPGTCEISLDLRALDAKVLAKMLAAAQKVSKLAAKKNRVSVKWERLLSIEPRLFDDTLIGLCTKAVKEFAGSAPKLPSGPLHDASEMAAIMPTVMVFAQSSPGISHCKEEDTPERHLDTSIKAFLRLVEHVVAHVAKQ
jgi:hydantoinase/carbamoylase family amidase